jgi:coenzyme F420 hydrogenase subunit beta
MRLQITAKPEPNFAPPEHRNFCTDCGLSRTSLAKQCATACQFIKPAYTEHEIRIHGRARKTTDDELFFGSNLQMHRAAMREPKAGAQWSGITTSIAQALLLANKVDAVITVGPDPTDSWRPQARLITKAEDLVDCRGMRMGYAPTLALVEPALKAGYQRLAVIGIPCQIHALRGIEQTLRIEQGLKELYVIGTPCSDNTTTENFHEFLTLVAKKINRPASDINYLEFCADYHVELRFTDGKQQRIPFLLLPLSQLRPDFFPMTCRTCVDYTNTLADVTVGYMAGSGAQWLIERNEKGQAMIDPIRHQLQLNKLIDSGNRQGAVSGFKANVERAAGGIPLRQMPNWLRPIVGWLMPKVGPKGLEFARARVEMKAIETVLHLRAEHPKRLRSMVPEHIWNLANRYGLSPKADELPKEPH